MSSECPFCDSTDSVIKGKLLYARYDNYPVSEGHTLIIPYRHISDYFESSQDEKIEIIEMINKVKKMLDDKHSPDGYNIGINSGKAAGQSVMHLHVHMIPRYVGDMDDPKGGVRGVIPDKQKYE
jgi:diadenosine tetraphosphate (Ap4A) HIT family hydrolase